MLTVSPPRYIQTLRNCQVNHSSIHAIDVKNIRMNKMFNIGCLQSNGDAIPSPSPDNLKSPCMEYGQMQSFLA